MPDPVKSAFIALLVGGVLAGCTACGWTESWAVYEPCDVAEGARAATVATDDILTVIPPSARAGDRMVTLPCEDEDALGTVERPVVHEGDEDSVRAFYKREFAAKGWELVTENPTVRREGQLDLGMGGLCFENTDQPDLSLKIHFSPTELLETWTPGSVPTSFFVSVHMMAPRFVCAG